MLHFIKPDIMGLKNILFAFLFVIINIVSAQSSQKQLSDVKVQKQYVFDKKKHDNNKYNQSSKQKGLKKQIVTVHRSDTLSKLPARRIEYKEE